MSSAKPPAKKDGRNGCLIILALVVFLFVPAEACSSGDSSSSTVTDDVSTAAPSQGSVLEDDPSGIMPPAQNVTHTCADVVLFSVTSSGNDGHRHMHRRRPRDSRGLNRVRRPLNHDDDDKVRMPYQKNYISGTPTDMFIYDAGCTQINLSSDPGTTLRFHGASVPKAGTAMEPSTSMARTSPPAPDHTRRTPPPSRP